MKSLVFICGYPRSGTTLLVNLLNTGNGVIVRNETKFIVEYFREYSKLRSNTDYLRFSLKLFEHFKTRRALKNRFNNEMDIFACLVKHKGLPDKISWGKVCEEILSEGEAIVVGEKTPGYVFHLDFLKETFPNAKFIFINRDPRDVFLSIKKVNWGAHNVYFHSLQWKAYTSAWNKFGSANSLAVSYEDLVQDSFSSSSALSEFLGTLLDPNIIKQKNKMEWRNLFNMTLLERLILEKECGYHMTKQGYKLTMSRYKIWYYNLLVLYFVFDQVCGTLKNKILAIPLKPMEK